MNGNKLKLFPAYLWGSEALGEVCVDTGHVVCQHTVVLAVKKYSIFKGVIKVHYSLIFSTPLFYSFLFSFQAGSESLEDYFQKGELLGQKAALNLYYVDTTPNSQKNRSRAFEDLSYLAYKIFQNAYVKLFLFR